MSLFQTWRCTLLSWVSCICQRNGMPTTACSLQRQSREPCTSLRTSDVAAHPENAGAVCLCHPHKRLMLAGAQAAAGSSGSPVGIATGVSGPVPHPQEAQPDSDSLRRACWARLPSKGCPAFQSQVSHACRSLAQAGVQAVLTLSTCTCPCICCTCKSHSKFSGSTPAKITLLHGACGCGGFTVTGVCCGLL